MTTKSDIGIDYREHGDFVKSAVCPNKKLMFDFSLLLVISIMTASSNARAQNGAVATSYYENSLGHASHIEALGAEMFGESTNLVDGSTTFTSTEVNVKTNSGIPMSVGRRLDPGGVVRGIRGDSESNPGTIFGPYWELNTPFISGTFDARVGWSTSYGSAAGNRCTKILPDAVVGLGPFSVFTYQPWQYWSGAHINIPNVGSEELIPAAGVNPTNGEVFRARTRSQWSVSCLDSLKNGTGQGFKVYLPNGLIYYFDWIASRQGVNIMDSRCRVFNGNGCSSGISIPRTNFYMYATRIEDRFGNWVAYNYDPINPLRLLSVTSNEGASTAINLTYADGRVSTISTGSRIWTYGYGALASLATMAQPDGGIWRYQYAGLDMLTYDASDMWAMCGVNVGTKKSSVAAGPGETGSVVITHPSGALGEFKFRRLVHGTTFTAGSCSVYTDFGFGASVQYSEVSGEPMAYRAISLTEKKISGPGISTKVWSYSYAPVWSWNTWTNGQGTQCAQYAPCATPSYTNVTGPDTVVTRYMFDSDYNRAGQLLQKIVLKNGVEQQKVTNYYLPNVDGLQFTQITASPGRPTASPISYIPRPITRSDIVQDGVTFTMKVNGFDSYARPTSITRSSTVMP